MHKKEMESLLNIYKLFIFLPEYRQGTEKVQKQTEKNIVEDKK